ncbi:pirin family protein [Streptomyces sp. NPDC056347]|uniref:pirin family protein n=1 Tax=Streptomyces sp. NPDC056347 TaxID=3345790 RepID=UPI0035E11B9A
MISVHRAEDRYQGGDQDAGILSRHAFSFGGFYDPDNLRFGPLMACNTERLEPGAGFEEHPHSHTEIVTWVVEGELTHRDSTGHASRVRPGDLQHLSAASGVRHVERNDGDTPLTFIQMWLAPLEPGGEPAYTIVPGLAGADAPYALPAAGALLRVHRPAPGERVVLPHAPKVYVQIVSGAVRLGGEELGPGDSVRISDEPSPELAADAEGTEFLVWELPA